MSDREQELILLFNQLFGVEYRTLLVAVEAEPLYQPASGPGEYHEIRYVKGHLSSALHEVAHWCIAGEARRRLVDYGYWYAPDGRSEAQQALFETLEVKPQALECLFSEACGQAFHVSIDNLTGSASNAPGFRSAIAAQAERFRDKGLPVRAARFHRALQTATRLQPRSKAQLTGS